MSVWHRMDFKLESLDECLEPVANQSDTSPTKTHFMREIVQGQGGFVLKGGYLLVKEPSELV